MKKKNSFSAPALQSKPQPRLNPLPKTSPSLTLSFSPQQPFPGVASLYGWRIALWEKCQ